MPYLTTTIQLASRLPTILRTPYSIPDVLPLGRIIHVALGLSSNVSGCRKPSLNRSCDHRRQRPPTVALSQTAKSTSHRCTSPDGPRHCSALDGSAYRQPAQASIPPIYRFELLRNLAVRPSSTWLQHRPRCRSLRATTPTPSNINRPTAPGPVVGLRSPVSLPAPPRDPPRKCPTLLAPRDPLSRRLSPRRTAPRTPAQSPRRPPPVCRRSTRRFLPRAATTPMRTPHASCVLSTRGARPRIMSNTFWSPLSILTEVRSWSTSTRSP